MRFINKNYIFISTFLLLFSVLYINFGKNNIAILDLYAQNSTSDNLNSPASIGEANNSDAFVTFIELGSIKCIPCKMMQPIMNDIEKEYEGKVKVVFYDVWTKEGQPYGEKYGIKGIPTQIFLDKNGKEFFRHTGFLSKNQIVTLLENHGVIK